MTDIPAGTSYNRLLRTLERNIHLLAPLFSVSEHLFPYAPEARKITDGRKQGEMVIAGMVKHINQVPLYSFSPSALKRLGTRPAEGWPMIFPTWPDEGCVVDLPNAAIFAQKIPAERAGLHWKEEEAHHDTTLWVVLSSTDEKTLPGMENAVTNRTFGLHLGLVGARKSESVCPILGHFFYDCPDGAVMMVGSIQVDPNAIGAENDEIPVFTGRLETFTTNTGKVQKGEMQPQAATSMAEHLSTILVDCWACLEFIDQPVHYVVQERPEHVPEERSMMGKKADRYHDRERWILLDPDEVKVRFAGRTDTKKGGEGTHASPAPHLRRGHQRTLRSERYTFRRGDVVHVRPTWVGDREWNQGRLRYRVISRIGADPNQA